MIQRAKGVKKEQKRADVIYDRNAIRFRIESNRETRDSRRGRKKERKTIVAHSLADRNSPDGSETRDSGRPPAPTTPNLSDNC